ncbi:MAG: sulfatase-like hydrolase/transferase [Akkermansiaceae bacterium]
MAADERPNIVLILGDDQAWSDYGFMGHQVIQTPHLDQLAKRSLVFERGYVSSPLCRPSLASVITGRFPFEHGIPGNDVDGMNKRAELDAPVRAEFHKLPSFVRMLTDHGYLAHQSGKWWEGSFSDGGFTHGMTHGDPKRHGRHGDAGLKIGREGMEPITEFIDMAVEKKKPFFVWYAPFLPHTPHNPPERLLEKYMEKGRAPDVAKYYAMCEWFDETCGQLTGYLDEKGLAENTLILFICDNGWAAKSTNRDDPDQKIWGQFALRSKGSPFENGIRTPILVSWPKKLKPEKSPDFAHAIDFFPTIAIAAGLKAPDDLPGIDLLNSETRKSREAVFGVCHAIHNMTPGDTDDTLKYLWCVEGEWKLIVRFNGKDTTRYRNVHIWDKTPVRLYNVSKDPHETSNLAEENPKVVERLRGKISAWHDVEN